MSIPAPLLALPATLILPVGLDQLMLDELLELWNHFRPRDAFERHLVSRILQATARLHISALRETDEADPLWLRYESAADRLFRQSLKALEAHRLLHPVTETASTQPQAAQAHPVPTPAPKPVSQTVTPLTPSPTSTPNRPVESATPPIPHQTKNRILHP